MTRPQILNFIAKLAMFGIPRYAKNAVIIKDRVFYFSGKGMHIDESYEGKVLYEYCFYNESELLEVILKCQKTS